MQKPMVAEPNPNALDRYALCRNCRKFIVLLPHYKTSRWIHIHNNGAQCFHPDSHKTDGSEQIGE